MILAQTKDRRFPLLALEGSKQFRRMTGRLIKKRVNSTPQQKSRTENGGLIEGLEAPTTLHSSVSAQASLRKAAAESVDASPDVVRYAKKRRRPDFHHASVSFERMLSNGGDRRR